MSTPTPPDATRKRLKLLPDWRRQSGTARNYQNVRTGEVLSRRQYDNRYGRVARAGFRSEYQQKKAQQTKWKSFYVEHFPVRNGNVNAAFQQMITRATELQHREMFVSAHGEAGTDYPLQAGSLIWVSTTGFYGDAQPQMLPELVAANTPYLAAVNQLDAWVWFQLTGSALLADTIQEFVLRWKA